MGSPRRALVAAKGALDIIAAHKAAGGPGDASLVDQARRSAHELEDFSLVLRLYDEARAEFPASHWMIGNFAWNFNASGARDLAWNAVRERVEAGHASSWILARAVDYAETPGLPQDLLRQAATRNPVCETCWKALADLRNTNAIAVWHEAIKANPGWAFPWIGMARAKLVEQANWSAAEQTLAEARTALAAADAPDWQITDLITRGAELAAEAVDDDALPDRADALAFGLSSLSQMDLQVASAKTYFDLSYRLHRFEGPSRALARATYEMIRLDGDTYRRYNVIFRDSAVAESIPHITKFRLLDRMIDRVPHYGDWVREVARFHTLWGGSAMAALNLLEQASTVDPELPVQTQIDEANAKLGTHKAFYRDRYDTGLSVGKSQRYRLWIEGARKKARSESRRIKRLDLDQGCILWVGSDGIEEERCDDLVSGQMTYFRYGAMEVHMDRDARGNLIGVHYGDGRFFTLDYSTPKDWFDAGEIIRIRTSEGDDLRMEHDPDTREPVRIEVVGVGHMIVTYDADGEVDRTRSYDAQSGEESHEVALRVTMIMQSLLGRVNQIRKLSTQSLSQWDRYPEDPALAALREDFESKEEPFVDEFVVFAGALVARVRDRFGYADEADDLLRTAILSVQDWDRAGDVDLVEYYAAVAAMILWHELQTQVRPGGIPLAELAEWQSWVDWLAGVPQHPELDSQIAHLNAALAQSPLRALSEDSWLVQTDLGNPGFWQTHRVNAIVPAVFANRTVLRDLTLWNDRPVVVSNKGLGLFQSGHWQWFTVDPDTYQLSSVRDLAEVDSASDLSAVMAIGGSLWLAGRQGVIVADGADRTRHVSTGALGSLALAQGGGVAQGHVAAGGADGLFVIDADDPTNTQKISDQPVSALHPFPGGWIAMGAKGSWFQPLEGSRVDLTDEQLTDSYHDTDQDRLYALRGRELIWTDASSVPAGTVNWRLLPGQEAIVATDDPYGLMGLDVPGRGPAVGVMTDQGISLFQNGVLDHLILPGDDRRPAALASDVVGGTLAVLTPRGLRMHLRDQAMRLSQDRVYDLITDPQVGVTYAAFGDRIEAFDHEDPIGISSRFVDISAQHLALAPNGDLITHSDNQILRYARGTTRRELLFEANPVDGTGSGLVDDIHITQDGTIWVTVSGSLFRWKDGEVAEFSTYADTPAPFNSGWLSTVFESPDGEVMVVASDESHITHNGIKLHGGLFRLRDGVFEKVPDDDVSGSWFVTASTDLGDGSSILATSGGFARMKGGQIAEFDVSEEASYMAAREVQPALYSGTRGTQLGEDLYLFGAVGGLVALHQGTWFVPDRINQMLPGRDFADYGSRAIHAVESDTQGRIYVGTDWGLTLFDPRGAGPERFLITEQRGDFAFSALEQSKMRDVNDILLEALPENSETERLAKQFRAARAQLAELEARLDADLAKGGSDKKLDQQVTRLRQRDIALLSRIEQANPSLFNMLALNPLDLQGLAKDLPETMVIAQFLPTDSRLYINLVGSDLSHVVEVELSSADLDDRVRRAVSLLRAQSQSALRGGFVMDEDQSTEPEAEQTQAQLTAILAGLYRDLLAPIENLVPEGATLVISPTGALNYLPFGALVRDTSGTRPSYAVERFDLAVAPTLYFLQQMLDKPPSIGLSHVVYGDPDGTLPGAREEAQQVADILAPDFVELRIGDEATYETLLETAPDARFLHLAMHGKLDPETPANSYLLLADNHQMTLPEIMTLPLAEAELVFLSACETAMGPDGVEIRTLAHAFAHAGVPSVLATLWAVNDTAMQALAADVYDAMSIGHTRAEALKLAQLAALERGGDFAQPGHWSGLILLGQP